MKLEAKWFCRLTAICVLSNMIGISLYYSQYFINTLIHVAPVKEFSNEYPSHSTDATNWTITLRNMTNTTGKQIKNIYFYNPQFYHVFNDWISGTWGTSKKFEGCPVSECIVTKGKIPIEKIDAIMFKPRDMSYCPPIKPLGQVWIFVEFETPNYYFRTKCFYDLKNKVNWTMTYRRDADFPVAHGYFRRGNKRKYSQKDLDDIFAKKNKTAVVFISHCPTVGKRLQFIKLLQSYGIQVDVFGLCGTKTLKDCGNEDRYKASFNVSGELKPDCFGTVLSQYKFFLSLENSLCMDYTTEKSLHRIMQHPIIPVIRDGSNASIFHPPHSYIHTSNYGSVKELAQHMKMLSANKTAYLDYFQWKQHYHTEDMYKEWNSAFCRICERLHYPEKYRRVYRDIAAWHISPGGKHVCHGPMDLR
ncbi:alpha-(1,3)-fucosyltransferase C-like [Mizuhopecten yessoensis]|uniref:Fucosyltransferase n=1 Tax=Mizuhopecten yessoensis TaxID=6573 RepID=A0A210PNH7_MIZYE|nr:alpha-(1,3)-fucosyltransferase C-like [Mizuhopecten yessoensis]XP_021379114.1 alpha-(1,3)-fucosyltransferase C-like [Mizuhopecten yessoensis]XP_021379115.1 alpha-(1,3)-fucosyltransferase C-like [Mizuhopecten yessoensis]OWF38041.1 Alpha-(1,3)-fucosyltransferase C [Mizuhopecten yessoensis]